MSSQLNLPHGTKQKRITKKLKTKLEMWANAKRDGRPAEYRWRPLFNAAVWLTPTITVMLPRCETR